MGIFRSLLALFAQVQMSSLPEENVWDYPRPAVLEKFVGTLKIIDHGKVVAETTNAYRVLETSHPPTYYVPSQDVNMQLFSQNARQTMCEWKGRAAYWDYNGGVGTIRNAAWCYEVPTAPFTEIRGYLSFYAQFFEECFVNEEKVLPQEGDFYGGWITSNLKGPMKGGPGTMGW